MVWVGGRERKRAKRGRVTLAAEMALSLCFGGLLFLGRRGRGVENEGTEEKGRTERAPEEERILEGEKVQESGGSVLTKDEESVAWQAMGKGTRECIDRRRSEVNKSTSLKW